MRGRSSTCDVAIVGGGPAGAWAAWSLARRGARVVVFDHSHPREKPCGGGVTGRALGLVAEAIDVGALPAVVIERARFDDPGTAPATVTLAARGIAPETALVVVDRTAFDLALLDAAVGAGAVHVAERVVHVEAGHDGVTVHTRLGTHDADWLLGADGAASLVRRRISRPFARRELSIASGYFVRGATSREIVVRFVADPAGYIWSFPRRDHLAVGICAQADETGPAPLRREVEAWLTATSPGAAARLEPYAWPIPSLGPADLDRQQLAGPRWLLAGDAAGLVDAITREGIFFALQSGRLGAEALALGGRGPAEYAARLHAEIYPELVRAARLRSGFFRGAFTRLLVDALGRSRPVRDVMADLVAGRQPYHSLKRRLLSTCEVRLAWQLLLLQLGRGRGFGVHSPSSK